MKRVISYLVSASVVTLLLCQCRADDARQRVLAFGGNGMIGSEVLTRLISRGGYDIVQVSRGNWPFDSAERVKPHLEAAIVCDRAKDAECAGLPDCDVNTLHYCEDFMKVVNATDKFDYVLDFSGYEAKWVHDAIAVLKDKVGYYVYISTDSVYEVCDAKQDISQRSVEGDAVRPRDGEKRDELRKGDPYGDAKLGSEEALRDQRREEGGFPWVALRFSDVIGPRDNTFRWILYHLWIKFYHDLNLPLHVPEGMENVTASFTYVEDAAAAIILAMDGRERVWDQAYNIAMEEKFTLPKMLSKIAETMRINGTETSGDSIEGSFFIYPTVFKGPVDVTKAKETLGFVPTSADTAFKATVAWYEEAFVKREAEREDMIKRFSNWVVPQRLRDTLHAAVGRVLEKSGIVKKKYHRKRKGDLEELERDEL